MVCERPTVYVQFSKVKPIIFAVSYYPGVYYFRFDDLMYSNYDSYLLSGVSPYTFSSIVSVQFSTSLLNRVSSVANCASLKGSFYASSNDCYIHSPKNYNIYCHNVKVGVAFEYQKNGARYEDNHEIEERILSVPEIQKGLSDIYNAKMIFSGGRVILNNADGNLDNFFENDEIIGNTAIIYVVNPCTEEKEQVFQGFVRGGTVSNLQLNVEIKDDKESLNIPLPRNRLTIDDYPDLSDDNIDRAIPYAFGNCKNVEVFCTNDNGSEPFYFICADTELGQIHDISDVYVDGVSVAFTKDLANNRFYLDDDDYDPGQKVTANIEGYEDGDGNLIHNACDILKFLFMTFFNFDDTSDFFDMWDTVHAKDMYLWIDEEKKFWEVVEEICRTSFLNILLNDNGSYSAFVNYRDGFYLSEIMDYDVISYGDIGYDSKELISSVIVQYNKDHGNDKYQQIKYDDSESEMFDIYNQYFPKDDPIETNLETETDAREYGEQFQNYFSELDKPVSIVMDYFTAKNLLIGFNYKINFSRPRMPSIGSYVAKIMNKRESLNDFTTTLDLMLIERIPETVEVYTRLWGSAIYGTDEWCSGEYEEVAE
jgi:hypothetical protein